jgi:CDP-diacylglycerol---serine O-phosphatidyltransferase
MEPIFPSFEPEPTPPQRRFRTVPLRLLVPNVITLAALAAGLTAVRFAIEGRMGYAAMAIILAAVLDGLDGRVARLLKGTSRFGAELDSLADFFSFGCAPALILYFWQLHTLKTVGWLACLLLVFAMALRLARFNVMIDAPERPSWQKAFATGVPAPAGAMLVMLPVHLSLAGMPQFFGESFLVLLWTLASTVLIVSRIPTFSGKGLGTPVPRERVLPILALAVVILALLLSHTFETVSALTLVYVALIPVAIQRYLRHKAAKVPETAGKTPESRVSEADQGSEPGH